jgi:hypothetical protein
MEGQGPATKSHTTQLPQLSIWLDDALIAARSVVDRLDFSEVPNDHRWGLYSGDLMKYEDLCHIILFSAYEKLVRTPSWIALQKALYGIRDALIIAFQQKFREFGYDKTIFALSIFDIKRYA